MADSPDDKPEVSEGVSYDQLTQEHPDRRFWKIEWSNFRLLYEGGRKMLRAAGQSLNSERNSYDAGITSALQANRTPRRFLYQLEGEPQVKYNARWERAFYIGYLGAIIDYFRHWLFSQPPEIRPCVDGEESANDLVPDWWDAFSEDCNGGGKSLLDFVRDSFLDVLICQRAGWLIGLPSQDIGAESDDDESPVSLTPYAAEEIIDWQQNDAGELDWVVLRKTKQIRQFPAMRKHVEVFTYVDRQSWMAWEVYTDDGKEGNALQYLGGADHGLGEVPFVWLEIPEGLWPANKLASWQIDLFNKQNMLSYGQLQSCFMQPYLKTQEEGAENRVFGEGIMLRLRSKMGDRDGEEFGWVSPDPKPLEFTAAQMKEQRDEGYRIIHQMSLAVDSQAVGAIARSGVSKVEDRRASEVILAGYGTYVRDAIVRTANLISQILGDDTEWECVGFDNFAVSSLEEELQTAALVSTFDLNSPTFTKSINKSIANRVLGHIDEGTRIQIEKEIDESVDQKQEQATAMAEMPSAMPAAVSPAGPDGKVPTVNPAQPPKPPGPSQASKPFQKKEA